MKSKGMIEGACGRHGEKEKEVQILVKESQWERPIWEEKVILQEHAVRRIQTPQNRLHSRASLYDGEPSVSITRGEHNLQEVPAQQAATIFMYCPRPVRMW